MGLFKPAWKNSNREKALKAIEKLTDQTKLERAALTAPDQFVRKEAAKKVINPNVLVQIVQNDHFDMVVDAALEQLSDAKSLAILVISGRSGRVQSAALKKITDQELLRDIVIILSADPEKISDPCGIRAEALEKITDQNALAQIARTAMHDRVKFEAACKLTDNALAQGIFLSLTRSESVQLRFDAAEKLSDEKAEQRVYFDILTNRSKSDGKERALKRLSDQTLLAEAAKILADPKVRLKIAEKLTDEKSAQPIFLNVAQSGADGYTRLRAADRLHDSEAAQSVYISVAGNDQNFLCRINAIQKIADQKVLFELVKNDSELKVQEAAVEKITDQTLLLELLRDVKGHELKQAVCGKIGHDWDKDSGCKTCRRCRKEHHVGPIHEKDAGGHSVTETCAACGKMIGYRYTDW